MAFPTTLGPNSARVISRNGNAFLAERDAITGAVTTWHNLGKVKDVKISTAPVEAEQDSTGVTSTRAHDFTVTFTLMQTSRVELGSISTIMSEGTLGSFIKFTIRPSKTAAGYKGVAIEDVEFAPTSDLPFDSENSGTVTFEGKWRGSRASIDLLGTPLAAADTARKLIVDDVLIGPYVGAVTDGF